MQQHLNVLAGSYAKSALKKAVQTNTFMSLLFPWEFLYHQSKRTAATDLMFQRKFVSEDNFDKIYWEGAGAAQCWDILRCFHFTLACLPLPTVKELTSAIV